MADHVFVCYAREDEPFVLALVHQLKSRSVNIWLDKLNIRPSDDWDYAIDKALYGCAVFLLVLSPRATESREVRGELRTALDENKRILPILYRSCQIPRQLRTIQYIDFSASEADDEAKVQQLIEVLSDSPPPPPLEKGGQRAARGDLPVARVFAPPPPTPIVVPPPILAPTFRNSIGMEFVLIPAGEFRMGSENGRENEKPVHLVRITTPFYLGKYQVTQGQWEAVMGNNPSRFQGDLNRPVEQVSWEDAQEFLRRLGAKEGKAYRLPTEAEWEYAARAGSTGAYCFGDDVKQLQDYAWYEANAQDTTHPVGQLKPNAWGLYDVHGNVWEWVQDWFDVSYYQRSPREDPQGPEQGKARSLRGGSWLTLPLVARASSRSRLDPGDRLDGDGLRCAQ